MMICSRRQPIKQEVYQLCIPSGEYQATSSIQYQAHAGRQWMTNPRDDFYKLCVARFDTNENKNIDIIYHCQLLLTVYIADIIFHWQYISLTLYITYILQTKFGLSCSVMFEVLIFCCIIFYYIISFLLYRRTPFIRHLLNMTLFSSCPVGCKLKSVNMSHFDSFSSSFEQSRHKMSDRVLKNQNKHSNRVNKFDIQSCFRVCRIKTLPRWLDINHCRIKGVQSVASYCWKEILISRGFRVSVSAYGSATPLFGPSYNSGMLNSEW